VLSFVATLKAMQKYAYPAFLAKLLNLFCAADDELPVRLKTFLYKVCVKVEKMSHDPLIGNESSYEVERMKTGGYLPLKSVMSYLAEISGYSTTCMEYF
jgi:hypothetical protein